MHPLKSKNHQCQAFTKEHRRCRLEIQDEGVCSIHRNYYTNWLHKHRPFSEVKLPTKRKMAEFDFQLKNKHVIITEHYCKALEGFNPLFYEYLINTADINPLWNEVELESVFYRIINRVQYHSDTWEIDQKRITAILTSPEVCKFIFKKIMYLSKLWIITPDVDMMYRMKSGRLLFLLGFLMPSGWKQMTGSTFFMEELTKEVNKAQEMSNQREKQDILDFLEHLVKPAIIEFNKEKKMCQKAIQNVFKEELMMEMWKPSRVQKWIDEGGWKLYDMMTG